MQSEEDDGRPSQTRSLEFLCVVRCMFAVVLTLVEEWFRTKERPDVARGQAGECLLERVGVCLGSGLQQRLAVPEDEPARCWRVDYGIQERLRSTKPGETVERIAAEEVDVARQVGTE